MRTTLKQNLAILFLAILFSFSACKKDNKVCDGYKELNDQHHLVDISLLKDVQQFIDTLTKYPQLQLYQVINDQYMYGMHCNTFYKGLKIFDNEYSIYKSKRDNIIFCSDTIDDSINILITPSIQYENAIRIAKQNLNFDNTCISYRLGIYRFDSSSVKNYKLVWKIQDEFGSRYVILDANTGEIYSKDDGIRY